LNPIIVVSGLLPYESGKTWFAAMVLNVLSMQGFRVAVFKPIAAHNIWYSWRTFDESVRLGVLVGNDILVYRDVLGLSVNDVILSNPIAAALSPLDSEPYIRGGRVGLYQVDSENQFKSVVFARRTLCNEGKAVHYFFPENAENVLESLSEHIENLGRALNASKSTVEDFLSYLTSDTSVEELQNCFRKITEGKDFVIVESFNDSIVPYMSVLDKASAAIVVAPGRAYMYRAHEVKERLRTSIQKHGELGFRSTNVINDLKPLSSVKLRFRRSYTDISDKDAETVLELLKPLGILKT